MGIATNGSLDPRRVMAPWQPSSEILGPVARSGRSNVTYSKKGEHRDEDTFHST